MTTRIHYLIACLLLCCGLSTTATAQGRYTVVIDAGHGGKDPGAVGNGVREKDVTLDVALRLGRKIKAAHPSVRVLYTRDKDVFIGLQERADFANRHKASLFISIHVNSASPSARGTETYSLGLAKQQSNMAIAMRENQVMTLEDDYKSKYQGFDPKSTEDYIIFELLQSEHSQSSIELSNLIEKQYKHAGRHSRGARQAGFWVLAQSAMPAVLTEVGFLTNKAEAAYLNSDSGREEIASNLARAFSTFYASTSPSSRGNKAQADESPKAVEQEQRSPAEPSTTEQADSAQSARTQSRQTPHTAQEHRAEKPKQGISYRIQFMSSPTKFDTKDKIFAPLKQSVRRTQEGKYYIYTVGHTSSLEEARKLRDGVRKHYKDCFIVRYQDGKRIGRVS